MSLEASYNDGQRSVKHWVGKHHKADFAAPTLASVLNVGDPAALSFFRFQAFTTATVKDGEVRQFMADALAENIGKGTDGRSFSKIVDDEFDRRGLTKLKPYQVENIYVTNTSLAFAAGQMSALVEVSADFPFWKYSATMDSSTRPSHAALHGKIFANGDFTFYPPLGFKCRCTAIPLTARQAGRYPKQDMPNAEQKEQMGRSVANAEFLGNKQRSYMEWLEKQYDTADMSTRETIDAALDIFKAEIEAKIEIAEPIVKTKFKRAPKLAKKI